MGGWLQLAADENIFLKILAKPTDKSDFSSPGDISRYLERKLGKYYNSLRRFYMNAFKKGINNSNTYVVFVARRCAVLGSLFLRSFKNEFNIDDYSKIHDSIYTDAGFRSLVLTIAYNCYRDFNYECNIYLYDDILIHGRAISSLLSCAEDIFVSEYRLLLNDRPDEYNKCSDEDLAAKFLSFIHIETAAQSKNQLLLKRRFSNRVENELQEGFEKSDANEWRDKSYQCADAILHSDTPNACFSPNLKLNSVGYDIIHTLFSSLGGVEKSRFQFIRTEYKGRSLDTYTWLLPVADKAQAVFTIRCTKHYIIPFALLPECSQEKMDYIEEKILQKIRSNVLVGDFADEADELTAILKKWNKSEEISVLYTEVINLILSLNVFKLFLKDLNGSEAQFSGIEFACLKDKCNIKNIMYNYAHESVIEKLIEMLLDPAIEPLFTYEEIEELFYKSADVNKYIVNNVSQITKEFKDENECEIIKHLEDAAFLYGSTSEQDAHSLAISSFTPSYVSIKKLRFPVKNSIEAFLNTVYSQNDGWCYDNAPLKYIIAYTLQFIDAGVLAISTGRNKEKYILTVRPGEQSLVTVPMRCAQYIPLMCEIEDRCNRQGRTPRSAFISEFDYFVLMYKQKDIDKDTEEFKYYEGLIYYLETLKRLADFLYSSGQSFKDYMFTVNIYFKNHYEKAKEQESFCKDLYYSIIY